jgi:Mg2+-importing ATPase
MADIASERFWCLPAKTVLARLRADPGGLSSARAKARLARHGPNRVVEFKPKRLIVKVARRIAEPLVAILLVAAAISGATGDMAGFAIILAVVAASITLDVAQEHRAEATAESLRRMVAVHADVRRDGALKSIPVENVVPGDVIELKAGDLVPADGLVLESHNAHLNEALMTGEAFPVEKRVGPCDAKTPAGAVNAVFAGTSVVSGALVMLAVATGRTTRFGGIAAALASSEPPTAFERGIHGLGVLILRLTILLTLFVLLAHLAFGRPVVESFLFAAALAVGLTPELLPMIMTVTLARGALRMADKQVIVKRISAIHDLGAMDTLCTDKTGTLTEARITLVGHPGLDGRDSERVLILAAVNSRFDTGIRSPLDEAIVAHVADQPLHGWSRIDEVPFDFARRCVTILARKASERILIIKGAPETILARVTAMDRGDGHAVPLDEAARSALERLQSDEAAKGHRLLAVAWKAMPGDRSAVEREDECDLVIAGFCVFVDPPKSGAALAIARLAAAGIRVKVISGDNAVVVRHLVETLKLPAAGLLTGAEIAALNDTALAAQVGSIDLYARVDPDQKTRIVRALQARGHIVGFLGDGVNDAPAIHAADVGFSVDGATDVARSAADMILLAHDLGVLADGVEEGRRTFANILKYVRMGTSSNFGNMLSMALASLVLPFLPLTPVQILLNNMLYDLSEIGIPFDRVDKDELTGPHAWNMREILRFTVLMGALSSLFDIATFGVLLRVFDADAGLFQTAWFLESMATQILVIFIIRTRMRAWASAAHPVLIASSLGALGVALVFVFSPLGAIFGFVAVPVAVAATVGAIVIAYLLAVDVVKWAGGRAIGA